MSKLYIGLGHYSRTGKDTFANMLVERLDYLGQRAKRVSFAGKLKQVAHDLYGHLGLRDRAFYDTDEGAPFRDIELVGMGKTPVQVWIELGNKLREIYADTWLDYVMEDTTGVDIIIVSDVRFPNEVEAIKASGGFCYKVTRPGVEPRDTVSDKALLDYEGWDAIINNSGNLLDLSGRAAIVSVGIVNTLGLRG